VALLFCTFTRASIFLLRFFVFVFWRRESLFFQELNSPRPPFFFFFNCRRTGPSHLTPQQSRREKERSHVDPRAEPVPRRHHQEQAQEPGLTGFFCARLVSQPTPKRLNNTEARWCCRCCRQGSCLATQEEGRTWYVFRPPSRCLSDRIPQFFATQLPARLLRRAETRLPRRCAYQNLPTASSWVLSHHSNLSTSAFFLKKSTKKLWLLTVPFFFDEKQPMAEER